jgi:hypothetical protein
MWNIPAPSVATAAIGTQPDAVTLDLTQGPAVHGDATPYRDPGGAQVDDEHRQAFPRRDARPRPGDGETPVRLVCRGDERLHPAEHEPIPVRLGHHGQVSEVAPGVGLRIGDTHHHLTPDDAGHEELPLFGRSPGRQGLGGQRDGRVDQRRVGGRHLEIERRLE